MSGYYGSSVRNPICCDSRVGFPSWFPELVSRGTGTRGFSPLAKCFRRVRDRGSCGRPRVVEGRKSCDIGYGMSMGPNDRLRRLTVELDSATLSARPHDLDGCGIV